MALGHSRKHPYYFLGWARMALALGKLTTGTPKFRGSGFVGIHIKPITAQEKFNFPRANAILARVQALLWVRDCFPHRGKLELNPSIPFRSDLLNTLTIIRNNFLTQPPPPPPPTHPSRQWEFPLGGVWIFSRKTNS